MTEGPETLATEVLIVGAGISGIGAGIELLRRGITSFTVLEAASELGGTWRDNRYPGIAVDIPSVSYCFSFETDFRWSREFAPGAEIQDYVRSCAQKYGITAHIRYGARARRCEFDSDSDIWTTWLDDGSAITSRYVIAATGLLSTPKLPTIPGLDTFAGKTMHTARWDHAHDVTSKRVAIIGTGASAVQIVPEIAARVAQLTVFQRTPVWVSPKADRPRARAAGWSLHNVAAVRSFLRIVSECRLECLTLVIVNYQRLGFVVRLVQRYLRGWMRRQVTDAETATELVPHYGLGCKRPTPSNTYLATFNRDNVRLITKPIVRICPEGIVTDDQIVHAADTLILATGFLTTERGNAPSFEVVGRDGVELGQFWEAHRLQAYAGVSVTGFPNFFLTAGPYSGGLNWFTMLESNLAHILRCIDGARSRGVTRVEVRREVHDRYMRYMWQRANGTVFKDVSCTSSNSYYLDRHGDASLPLPHTPWWRILRGRWQGTRGYDFGATVQRQRQPASTPET